MLTRAAAAQERLRKSELKAPQRSRRIRETMEARATNVQGASKTGKRTSTSKESESRRKEPPAIVTSRITKTAKARSKRAKKVDASRVLRAVEEHSERLQDAGRQFTPENDLTNPNLSTAPGHNGPELIDEDMADAERAIEEPTSADLPGSASPQNESVNASPSRHSHNDPVYSTRPRKSPSPKDDLVGTRTGNRYDDRVSAGRTAEQNRPRVSSEDAASLHEDGAKAADPERSSPLDNRDDDLGDMFSEERMSSEESDVTARYDRWRSREQPRQYYHGRPYQVGDRWRHRPGMDNDSQDSFSQEGEGEYPDPYHRSPRPARDRFFRKRFPQALFGVVIAQRALRRKRIQLQDCRHQTEEARFMVEMYQKGTTFVPTSEHEWRIDQAIRENLAEWKTHVSLRQGIESEIKFQIQHPEHRAAREIARLERASSPNRGDQQLHYLSENHDFWKTFDECEATADTLADIDFGLNQNERERDAIDDAIDRDYGPSPDFGEGVPSLSSTVWERDQNRLLASIPYVLRRYEELQLEKKTAEALREEQWSRLANLAEDALVGAKALEVLIFEEEQEYQRQECEVPKHTKKATTQEAAPLEPAPEQAEAPQPSNADQDLRQSLLVAKEAYRKAREDFEGARDLTRAEIAKLPQPVTEDDLGAATFQKLGRLTRVLAETENEFLDLKKRVQRAGLARPAEQTSDFSDQPDDEISETLLKEVADQSRERILKMQHWNGLDMESARSMSPDIPRPAAKTLMALPDVRVGEDSFECTEATGRTRERIDIMQALSRNIREQGDVPMADADSIIYDPEDEEL